MTLRAKLMAISLSCAFLVVITWMGVSIHSAYGAPDAGSNQLSIDIAATDYSDELKTSDLLVDIYKIADAVADGEYDAYDYPLNGVFAEDKDLAVAFSAGEWETVAKRVTDIVSAGDVQATVRDYDIVGRESTFELSDGVYAVVPHGSAGVLEPAYSARHAYAFLPSIVTLPTKSGSDGVPSSGGAGGWLQEMTICLKPDRSPLYGDIRIDKSVDKFSGEPATFVFRVWGSLRDGELETSPVVEYDNYVSMFYDGTEESSSVSLTHIPAGMKLNVEEVYSSSRYDCVGSSRVETDVVPSTVDVERGSKPALSVSFSNVRNDKITGGGGIENHFDYDGSKHDSNGWTWTKRPEGAKS